VGHGWTCQALGIDISHWDPIGVPLTEETRGMLAQVRGQRALQWDRPMITSLCFSQPQVRRRMVQSIVDHSLAHPNVDLLHVWLDDGGNNKCECEECSKSRPADLYVQMLHELDAALTAVSSPMRIVFISYSDLLWPPKEGTKPLNPQRFTFLYANARASYQQALTAQGAATMPDYVRNQTGNTQTPECFRGFLNAWKAFFPIGDHILFEYHLGGFRSNVLNQHDLARVIHADIAALKSLGFNGFISCQAQRVFFPTGLPCYAMGQTLWDNGQNLDVLRDDYFMAAFGQDGGACKEFLKVAAEILSQAVRFEDRVVLTAQAPMQLFKLEARVTEFERLLARNTAVTDLARARSWYYMGWYVRLLREFVALLGAMTTSKQDAVLASWQRFRSFLTSNEIHYHAVFDVPDFLGTLERYITEGRFSSLPQAVVQ